jgi:O-antigen/teichoic acid export membrane protein
MMLVPAKSRSALVVRNTLINFISQVAILLAAIALLPFIVDQLGVERFGIFSLSLTVLAYMMMADLGISRATTKYVAGIWETSDLQRMRSFFWTSLPTHFLLGVVGSAVYLLIFNTVLLDLLIIPPSHAEEARSTLLNLSFFGPVLLAGSCLRGVLEGMSRFDITNIVNTSVSICSYGIIALSASLAMGLPDAILLIFFVRSMGAIVYFFFCLRFVPALRHRCAMDRPALKTLLTFGGWVSISNIANPILEQIDRFVVPSLVSMRALTYYAVPLEAISRIRILPSSLTIALFPRFSALESRAPMEIPSLFSRSMKFLTFSTGVPTLILLVFAEEILGIWVGDQFVANSTIVLRILLIGMLVNSVAWIPYSFLQAVGRPDIPAKIHAAEVPFYFALCLFLTKGYGIDGTAAAWSIRASVDAFVMFVGAMRLLHPERAREPTKSILYSSLWLGLVAGIVVFLVVYFSLGFVSKLVLVFGSLVAYTFATWFFVLEVEERKSLQRILSFDLVKVKGWKNG